MKCKTCITCKKRITNKLLNSQKVLQLEINHSISEDLPLSIFGDVIVNSYFCSEKCFDKMLKECRTLKEIAKYVWREYE